MKKMIPVLMICLSLAFCLFCNSCKNAFATGPANGDSDTTYVAFTKGLKQRLDHDNIDLTRIQFYVDQKLILRHVMGAEKGTVKSGILVFDNGQYVNEIEIPAFTPGVCEKTNGDDLMVSFDLAGKDLEFTSPNGNSNFILAGSNWHNGMVDVTYDNQVYSVQCSGCNNAGDAKLVVRRNQAYKKEGAAKVVAGRKL